MSYYGAVIYLTVLSMLIMLLFVQSNEVFSGQEKRMFQQVFWIVILSALAEWMGIRLNGAAPVFRPLHILVKTFELSFAPFLTVAYLRIIAGKKAAARLAVPVMLNAVLEILSAFLGFIYYVDADNVYHHGPYYWIYIAFYMGCSLIFILECMWFGKKYQSTRRMNLFLGLILFYMMSGAGISLFFEEVRAYYICLAVDTIFVYIYYNGVVERTDALTGLLNRRVYEQRLNRLQDPTMILFFDVDNFKEINDSYGHIEGDACLRTVGSVIWRSYSHKGTCCRIGGDEFCVMLNRLLDESGVEALNRQFFAAMEAKRAADEKLPFVSVGYALYDPASMTVEDAIKKADEEMYRVKAVYKKRREEQRKTGQMPDNQGRM